MRREVAGWYRFGTGRLRAMLEDARDDPAALDESARGSSSVVCSNPRGQTRPASCFARTFDSLACDLCKVRRSDQHIAKVAKVLRVHLGQRFARSRCPLGVLAVRARDVLCTAWRRVQQGGSCAGLTVAGTRAALTENFNRAMR